MKMVCKNCGKENAEGTKFCVACGTPLGVSAASQSDAGASQPDSDASQADAGASQAKSWESSVETAKAEAAKAVNFLKGKAGEIEAKIPGDEKKKKLILLGGLGAAVLVVVLLVLMGGMLFGDPAKKAFTEFVKGGFSCDFKKVWNNSLRAEKAQKALDLYDEDDYADLYEDTQDEMNDQKEDWKDDGIKYEVTVDIKSTETISKSDREFEWAQKMLEAWYDCDASNVQAFSIIEARIKADYYEDGDRDKSGDVDRSRTQYLMVKLSGGWYLLENFNTEDIKQYLKNNYKN